MSFTMVVDQYNLGAGEIYIHGLGTFTNGTYEISDEQEQNFRVINATETSVIDEDPKSATFGMYIMEHELGPDLLTAAESMHGVTVTENVEGTSSEQDNATSMQGNIGAVGSLSTEGPGGTGSE